MVYEAINAMFTMIKYSLLVKVANKSGDDSVDGSDGGGGSGGSVRGGDSVVHCCRINKTWQTQHSGDSSGLNELQSLAAVRRQPVMISSHHGNRNIWSRPVCFIRHEVQF